MSSGWRDWSRNYGLVGQDEDGNPVLLRVQPGGQLEVLLRGLYLGELRTVALDDSGFLAAYVLDDESMFGDVIRVGNAELAARLGMPIAHDWRGQVQSIYDFSTGLHGITVSSAGTGASAVLSPVRYVVGGYSLALTGGSTTPWEASAILELGPTPSDRFGIAVRFSCDTAPEYITVSFSFDEGTTEHSASIRYDFDNTRLEYLDGDEAWQILAVQTIYQTSTGFHNLKLVIDKTARTYTRVLLNQNEHELTEDYYTGTIVGGTYNLSYVITVKSDNGENDTVYIDSIVITANEPS